LAQRSQLLSIIGPRRGCMQYYLRKIRSESTTLTEDSDMRLSYHLILLRKRSPRALSIHAASTETHHGRASQRAHTEITRKAPGNKTLVHHVPWSQSYIFAQPSSWFPVSVIPVLYGNTCTEITSALAFIRFLSRLVVIVHPFNINQKQQPPPTRIRTKKEKEIVEQPLRLLIS
jgi:hypothetical protein